jgi:hypothetical protein
VNDEPIPFEVEYPGTAAFMQRVYAVGGVIRFTRFSKKWKVFGVSLDKICPCGSGKSVVECHVDWMLR